MSISGVLARESKAVWLSFCLTSLIRPVQYIIAGSSGEGFHEDRAHVEKPLAILIEGTSVIKTVSTLLAAGQNRGAERTERERRKKLVYPYFVSVRVNT
jgi:hypothetical protein